MSVTACVARRWKGASCARALDRSARSDSRRELADRVGRQRLTSDARTPKALWEKGRGDQRTPAGEIAAYACWNCGGRDVTSSTPVPGPPGHKPSRRYDAAASDS
jgi:hypothetical protein